MINSSNRGGSTATFIRTAVAAAVAGTFSSGAAIAQSDTEEATQLDSISVTGSRIKRPEIDSASPVTVITREDIIASGITDVGDLLQRIPSMSGSPIGTTTNNGGNGSVQIDLRGMGVDRTLTLVNGKRTVDGGDYQTIPASMIERVEILKDGGSAIYGADAVAGVVNIITRTDFEGLSLDAQTSDWMRTDNGGQSSFNFVAGKNFDGGNFVFGAEFVDQKAAYQSDTPWDFFQDSYYIYPEGCENQVAAPYDGTPTGGCYPIGSSRIPEGRLRTAENVPRNWGASAAAPFGGNQRMFDWFNGEFDYDPGTDGPNPDYDGAYATPVFTNPVRMNPDGTGLVAYDGRTYNYAPVNYVQTPYERTNLFLSGTFDITNNIKFKTNVRGNIRNSAQELAPMPYNSPTDPGYSGTWTPNDPNTGNDLFEIQGVNADGDTVWHYDDGTGIGATPVVISYNGISEQNYYLVQEYTAAGLDIQPVTDARRRMVETTRRFTQDITQVQGDFGFTGSIMDMDWDVYYNKGYRSRIDRDVGQFAGNRFANAVGPSADLLAADGTPGSDGVPECYGDTSDPTTIIAGCVPFNMFGGPFSVTQDMLDYVAIDLVDTFQQTQDQMGFNLTGNAFALPGGALGWAAGYEYQGQYFEYSPDSNKQIDNVTGNTGAGTRGNLYSNSLMGEVFAPVFDNGDQSVGLKLGLRYDDFNRFDSELTYQFGVEFQALKSLKLRATTGTVFRSPTIVDLFAGEVDSFPTYSDPCITTGPLPATCAMTGVQTDSQVLARVGGNPDLIPETGDTFTLGMAFTPELGIGNLEVTLDYWQVNLEDGISSLGVQYILDDCYINGNAASCALITRRADYSIAQIRDLSLNVAEQGATGIDTEVRYGFSTVVGRMNAAFLWTHLLERTKVAFPGDAEQDLSGRYTDPTAEDGGAYAGDKINYSLRWKPSMVPGLEVAYLGEFISALDADTFCNCDSDPYIQNIDMQWYHDITAEYTLPGGLKVLGGITNVLDQEPPYIEVGFNATTDPSAYRVFGQGYFLRLAKDF